MPRALVTEMEVVAGDGVADAKPPDKNLRDEILGADLPASAASKSQDQRSIHAEAAASTAFSGCGVRRKIGLPVKKARGCGSKVSMSAGTPR